MSGKTFSNIRAGFAFAIALVATAFSATAAIGPADPGYNPDGIWVCNSAKKQAAVALQGELAAGRLVVEADRNCYMAGE